MRSKLMWMTMVAFAIGLASFAKLRATPQSGFTASTLAKTTLDEFQIEAKTIPADIWQARMKTHGNTDLYVQSNVWTAGGTTGWHTHPGPSFVIVTAGTVTNYDGDDATCTPHIYTVGMSFIDRGDGHAHLIRNETGAEARTVAVQFIPEAATRRIDLASPGNCPF